MLEADGFEEAIIGVVRRCGQPDIIAYSYEAAVEVLVEGGASWEEAVEYLEYNAVGAWVGEETPAWVITDPDYLEELRVEARAERELKELKVMGKSK
jgi:hypothetical protein